MRKIILLVILFLAGCTTVDKNEVIFVRQSEVLGIDVNKETVGFVVPLYLYPTDDYLEYERIIELKRKYPEVPIIMIINPHNGPGEFDDEYVKLVSDLGEADITMIGYVHVSYGKRSLFDIETDISKYEELYPEIKGYFVDEVDHGGNTNYYNSIKTLAGERDFLVGNPGTHVDEKYFSVFDILVIAEMMYDDITEKFLTPLELKEISNIQKSVISYSTSDEVGAIWISNYVNWIYITEYDVYHKLSGSFEEQVEYVDKKNRG